MQKIVIIGGVAGGMSAATRLRRLMEDAEIIVFEKGPFVSFANCGLPYFVSGDIKDREALLLQTPTSLQKRFGLDVRTFHEVIAINPVEKTVTVKHDAQLMEETYDQLILATGTKPFLPLIKGLNEAKNVFSLRNVPDLDQIMSYIVSQEAKKATIIGAGFIGLEMAENLQRKGLTVTIVEQAAHVLPTVDEEMAAYVQQSLTKNGVKIVLGKSVVALEEDGRTIRLMDESTINTDLTILAVGVQPATALAKAAGIELGYRGGVLVDENYQTSQKDIYAVGDAIIVKQQITGEDALISLASPANRQGRQVADVLAGLPRKNKGSIGTAIVRVFEMTAASTGLSERNAKMANLPVQVVHISGKDHAGYYPGATDMHLKLIFHPETGEIYGAQAIGEKGVDKRIDVLATAIKGGLTVFDLPELELTYAPPFGSAKDPVNMIGYAAMNLIEGLSDSIQWHELPAALQAGNVLLDVRSDAERQQSGTVKNALHIPVDDLRCRLSELDPNKSYIISCHSGLRSYIAERILKQSGFHCQNLDGAFQLLSTVRPEMIDHVSNH